MPPPFPVSVLWLSQKRKEGRKEAIEASLDSSPKHLAVRAENELMIHERARECERGVWAAYPYGAAISSPVQMEGGGWGHKPAMTGDSGMATSAPTIIHSEPAFFYFSRLYFGFSPAAEAFTAWSKFSSVCG